MPIAADGSIAVHDEGPTQYYDVPLLKQPTWHWHIGAYFFLEGIAAGAFMLSALAGLTGRGRFGALRSAGRYIALAALAPCPPLLIADLGRPERFHHMLRIFKPTSPMSHGAWALTAFGAPAGLLAAGQFFEDLGSRKAARLVPSRALEAVGLPISMVLATYPGVLLSTTANPLWGRGRLLGALFAASAVHSGAAAVSTALALRRDVDDEAARLSRIERIATLAEAGLLAAFVATAGPQRKHLLSGPQRKLFLLGAIGAGLALPMLLEAVAPKRGRAGTIFRIAGAVLSLVGAFALKRSLVRSGKSAAADPRGAHEEASAMAGGGGR